MNGSESSETTHNARLSPSRDLFRIAFAKIQSNRRLHYTEILLWTILAIYLGFLTFNLTPFLIGRWVFRGCYWAIIALTPFVIGAWVYRVHFVPGSGDETLRSVPMTPSEVINPRMWAVAVSWLRLLAPVILLMVISHESQWSTYSHDFCIRMLRAASGWLLSFPYKYPLQLEYECGLRLDDDGNIMVSALMRLNHLGRFVVIGLAALQSIAWISLPIAWGFYWRTRLKKGGSFWFFYFTYPVMPFILAYINYQRVQLPPVNKVYPFYQVSSTITTTPQVWGFHQGWLDWLWMLLYGLSGIILSAILYYMALRSWGRCKV